MKKIVDYQLAETLEEALTLLAKSPTVYHVFAGGTDLLLELGAYVSGDVALLDISKIDELKKIDLVQDHLFVGCAATFSEIIRNEAVRRYAPALVDSSSLIGGPQLRMQATIGGNVAHGLPAADGAISLLALGAEVELVSLRGKRRFPLEDFFVDIGQTKLQPDELLYGFYLPVADKDAGSAHVRVSRPQGVAIAILNVAVWLACKDKLITDLRIAIGPAGRMPLRLRRCELKLKNKMIDEVISDDGLSEIIAEETSFRTSKYRASKEYRQFLSSHLLKQAISKAWNRAKGE